MFIHLTLSSLTHSSSHSSTLIPLFLILRIDQLDSHSLPFTPSHSHSLARALFLFTHLFTKYFIIIQKWIIYSTPTLGSDPHPRSPSPPHLARASLATLWGSKVPSIIPKKKKKRTPQTHGYLSIIPYFPFIPKSTHEFSSFSFFSRLSLSFRFFTANPDYSRAQRNEGARGIVCAIIYLIFAEDGANLHAFFCLLYTSSFRDDRFPLCKPRFSQHVNSSDSTTNRPTRNYNSCSTRLSPRNDDDDG